MSKPTIYRRLKHGEIKGALCIDSSGKHWEVYESELPRLGLKRKYNSSSRTTVELPGAAEDASSMYDGAAVYGEPRFSGELSLIGDDSIDSVEVPADSIRQQRSGTADNEAAASLRAELVRLDAAWKTEKQQLLEELDAAKDEASYWRGRWEESSRNFEALRQNLVDRSAEDQEEIWELRDQVADLQEQVEQSASTAAGESSDSAAYEVSAARSSAAGNGDVLEMPAASAASAGGEIPAVSVPADAQPLFRAEPTRELKAVEMQPPSAGVKQRIPPMI